MDEAAANEHPALGRQSMLADDSETAGRYRWR
jgi:hypothetical protein